MVHKIQQSDGRLEWASTEIHGFPKHFHPLELQTPIQGYQARRGRNKKNRFPQIQPRKGQRQQGRREKTMKILPVGAWASFFPSRSTPHVTV